ncbi:hypothetical protein NUITMVRA1_13360 [Aerococcus viridans]|nr:hypothetical protein NUITMVRA1_13360 [Aerococcus viridans]
MVQLFSIVSKHRGVDFGSTIYRTDDFLKKVIGSIFFTKKEESPLS